MSRFILGLTCGAIFAAILPQFLLSGGSLWRLPLMLCSLKRSCSPGCTRKYLLGGQSRFGRRMQVWLQGVTGGILLALGARLAAEQ